jgi:putative ABC transport system ATP-binding protein
MNKVSGVPVISAPHNHEMLGVSDRVVWMHKSRVYRIINRDELTIEVGPIDGHGE